MDVMEIDAATHTQVDNIRDVIISGLSIAPVRNRYKVFIIDEVHQLSSHSFNALLKSVEEPPAHVVFMMATTELDKIPETILSRSQVYEFRNISTTAIAAKLREIVDQEGITVGDDTLQLIARDAEGSMRDAQSKLDQVIAFTGKTITPDDVATVLGLVGRDLLLDTLDAVAAEDAPASFALTARAVEMGYDLRAVCRELSRVVRDVLVLSVDPSRISDPEIASEGDRDRLQALAGRFSREDLLRAFDLLTRAEQEIKSAAQPRYHLEMALLRWIHLRKLMPIEDLIAGAAAERTAPRAAIVPARTAPAPAARTAAPPSIGRPVPAPSGISPRPPIDRPAPSLSEAAARAVANVAAVPEPKQRPAVSPEPNQSAPVNPEPKQSAPAVSGSSRTSPGEGKLKDGFLSRVKAERPRVRRRPGAGDADCCRRGSHRPHVRCRPEDGTDLREVPGLLQPGCVRRRGPQDNCGR